MLGGKKGNITNSKNSSRKIGSAVDGRLQVFEELQGN